MELGSFEHIVVVPFLRRYFVTVLDTYPLSASPAIEVSPMTLLRLSKLGQQYRHTTARRDVSTLGGFFSQVVVLCLGLSAVAHTPGA